MNRDGIFPMVLAILNDNTPILLNAAASVTAPEGINGKTLRASTRKMASAPEVLFNFNRSLDFECLNWDDSFIKPLRYKTKLTIAPAASPAIETISPRSKPKKAIFPPVIKALGKMPDIAITIFIIKLTRTARIGFEGNRSSNKSCIIYPLPDHL